METQVTGRRQTYPSAITIGDHVIPMIPCVIPTEVDPCGDPHREDPRVDPCGDPHREDPHRGYWFVSARPTPGRAAVARRDTRRGLSAFGLTLGYRWPL
jgi:hypothetical protein